MKIFKRVLLIIFILTSILFLRVVSINNDLDTMIAQEAKKIDRYQSMDIHIVEFKDLNKGNLAYNPIRVIALARYLNKEKYGAYERSNAFRELYRDQIDSIIRRSQYPTAIVFWLRYKRWDTFPYFDI